MTELSEMYARQRKYIFFLLAMLVLGWGFTDYQTIFLGLILGTAISLFNLWHLARKTEKFGDAVIKGGKKKTIARHVHAYGSKHSGSHHSDGVS